LARVKGKKLHNRTVEEGVPALRKIYEEKGCSFWGKDKIIFPSLEGWMQSSPTE
jgi:hypothetical protein